MKSVIEITGDVSENLKKIATNVALAVIEYMGQPDELEVAINFVSEEEIKRINNEFRGIDKVTDVLSFPSTLIKVNEVLNLSDPELIFLKTDVNLIHFGDMAICIPQLERQSKEYGVPIESELKKLVIHSMLHFMGYDHTDDKDYLIMNEKEIELSKLINI